MRLHCLDAYSVNLVNLSSSGWTPSSLYIDGQAVEFIMSSA